MNNVDHKKLKIAYHETGHAVMALVCRQGVQKISLKEMDSPSGTDKYLGSMVPEPFKRESTVTINELNNKIMISLAGFAGDGLFSDGLISNFGGDDLIKAIRWVENMLESKEFRKLVEALPSPAPGKLDMIENPLVRRYIDYMMAGCFETLEPFKPVIKLIAEELYKKGELSGGEVSNLFNSFVKSKMAEDQVTVT